MTLERAKKLLDKEYERFKKLGAQKPLTSALYSVWCRVDRSLGIKSFTVTESGETIIEYEGEENRLKECENGYEGMLSPHDAYQKIMELAEENARLENALVEQSAENVMLCGEVKHARVDTVRRMHSEIKKRCIKGGIYPAFVKSTIDKIAKEMEEAAYE